MISDLWITQKWFGEDRTWLRLSCKINVGKIVMFWSGWAQKQRQEDWSWVKRFILTKRCCDEDEGRQVNKVEPGVRMAWSHLIELIAEQRGGWSVFTWTKQKLCVTKTRKNPLEIRKREIQYRNELESHWMRRNNLAPKRGEDQGYVEADDELMKDRCVSVLQRWHQTHKHK